MESQGSCRCLLRVSAVDKGSKRERHFGCMLARRTQRPSAAGARGGAHAWAARSRPTACTMHARITHAYCTRTLATRWATHYCQHCLCSRSSTGSHYLKPRWYRRWSQQQSVWACQQSASRVCSSSAGTVFASRVRSGSSKGFRVDRVETFGRW